MVKHRYNLTKSEKLYIDNDGGGECINWIVQGYQVKVDCLGRCLVMRQAAGPNPATGPTPSSDLAPGEGTARAYT